MDIEPRPEARIIALGEPVEGADPLFIGTLHAALEEAWRHDEAWLANVAIWTEDRVFGAADIEALRLPPDAA